VIIWGTSSAIDDQPAAEKEDCDSESDSDDDEEGVIKDVQPRCADLDQKDCKDAFSSFGLLCNWNRDTENCDKEGPHTPAALWIRTTETNREWMNILALA